MRHGHGGGRAAGGEEMCVGRRPTQGLHRPGVWPWFQILNLYRQRRARANDTSWQEQVREARDLRFGA